MTVTNVQDVMLAAVAVSGMGDDIPKADAQEPIQASRKSAETAAEQAEAVAEQKEPHAPLSEEQTSFITQQLNEIMRNINVDLQFQYHKEIDVMSVQMLDKKTGKVLREVPPEAMVKHMIKVHDWIGAFLDKTA